jgi:hypothetical protein
MLPAPFLERWLVIGYPAAVQERHIGPAIGFYYAGHMPDSEDSRPLSLKVGGYQLRANRQGEIPYVVDDTFLQRESGIFGSPLLGKD